jgi:hypothetical protein
MSQTISVGRNPRIIIESIGGDLSLVGWEGEEILLKGDEDEIRCQQVDGQVAISCRDDLSLRVPRGASVSIQNIGGDAAIRGVTGGIEIKEIQGDLSVRDVEEVAIEAIKADFSLRGAKGNLSVKKAGGDVSIREVEGEVSLGSVSDDLALRDVRGNIRANVGEDVVLYLTPRADQLCNVTAGEDLLLVLPTNVDATLTLHGDEINVDWPGVAQEQDATERVITLGSGSAKIELRAGGEIRLTNKVDAGESAEEFGNFAGINFDWSGFGERISKRVEQASRRAARQAEDAARRVERGARRAEQRIRANVNVGRWNWDLTPKGVPLPPGEPVREEERLAILKMLQDKKITADEAEKLLSALEGGV